jgi:uncharacterized LabA/DUF88 family protein
MTYNRDQRVGIFIDIQNLYHSAKHLHRARVNFPHLIKHLLGSRKLIRTIGYVVKSDVSMGEASFFDALENAGIELRMKDLQIYADGSKKADWDIGMAVDAIRTSSMLDVVILVTGDGDFVPLVEYLKWGVGRYVEVASFGRSTSSKLRESADLFIDLDSKPALLLRSPLARAAGRRGGKGRNGNGNGNGNGGRQGAHTSSNTK